METTTPISSLPPEILTIIFEHVHAEHVVAKDLPTIKSQQSQSQKRDESDDESDDDGSDSETSTSATEWEVDVDRIRYVLGDPSFFPYALGAVCQYWENILSATPAFWTCVVLFLDDELTELEKARQYLSWSRDFAIDVFMTRRGEHCPDDPWYAEIPERRRVFNFMQCLLPHFHRCRTLHVDVSCSVSLPVIPTYLPCETPLLQHFSFDCDIVCPTAWSEDYHEPTFATDLLDDSDSFEGPIFEFKPKLKTLAIDGRNFQLALTQDEPWMSDLDDLEDLTISHYASTTVHCTACKLRESNFKLCNKCRLSLYLVLDTVAELPSLENLTFDSVTFDILSIEDMAEMYDLSNISILALDGMAPDIIQEIFRVCTFDNPWSISFIRCPRLNEAILPSLETENLCLFGLGADIDLERIVKGWEGGVLYISCCSSFSDAFLEMLATPEDIVPNDDDDDDDDPPDPTFPCNGMTAIDIQFTESLPYSVAALRKMVEARGCNVDYSDEGWGDNLVSGPAISRIHARDKVPELSREDEEWFRSRLVEFRWGE